jgi:hypothetical protein
MRFYTETVCSNDKRTSIVPVRYESLTFATSTHTGSTNLTLQAQKNIHLVKQSLIVLRPSARAESLNLLLLNHLCLLQLFFTWFFACLAFGSPNL